VIDDVIERWHKYLGGELVGGPDELLSDHVPYCSPGVYTPQRGKLLTTQCLDVASRTVAGEVAADGGGRAFQYTKQVLSGDTAVHKFKTRGRQAT
jgi:hypothetical protein